MADLPTPTPTPPPKISWGPILVFATIAGVFVIILVSIFIPYLLHRPFDADHTLLIELSRAETARGLITFLVAVSAMGIALVVIVYITVTPDPNLKDRFEYAKEVFISLVGILGTIIGFYFGTYQTQAPGASAGKPLTLAELNITPPKPAKGDTVTLHATLSGGQSPYTYTIKFTPDTMKEISDKSSDGKINQEVQFDAYDPTKPLDIIFQASDAAEAITGKRIHLASASQSPPASASAGQPLTLAELNITPPKPAKADMVTVHATLSGGQSPYTYTIKFTPDTMKEISGKSLDGKINQEVKFDAYDPTKPLDVVLEGKDAAGGAVHKQLNVAAIP
jgi:alpha-acetolactate decarboxylase